MLFEVGSIIVMGGLAGYASLKTSGSTSNDADKIQRIFANAGWNGRNSETIRLQRKAKFKGGVEYVYQIPLGFDRKKIEADKHILEDGLNIRHKYLDFDPSELLKIKFDKTVLQQIKKILTNKKIKRKEIELSFDGMLRIKVYNERMQDQYDWDETYLKPGTWSVSIGQTRKGTVRHDFDEYKHLIIAGASGYGKSAILKLIVTSLVLQQPDNVNLHLIDLKGGSAFQRFKDIKQVKNYTREPEETKDILAEIQKGMNKTYTEIVDEGFEDIKESGRKERHFIIIDEAADIADNSACMDVVTDIARRGRGAGYYLIYATQYPSSQSIPQQTKRNIPSRLCFVLDDATASNTALGQTGAEELPLIPGRGIYKNVKSQVVQTPYLNNKEIKKRITPHIVIKPRKETESDNVEPRQGEERGSNSFEYEEM
ncbi:FtsK/SpoIIIE domain-containing protein [Metabacillus litoralis]|uniref:FtsK/SpoIIIE domain-containing protein n=1 Tax=Metabacillus litoralis TaxID=152268 RepID=UPI00203DC251|nr:FtsK/SpoIIIE domain-containing protein [Metabacillus litoralis]MCM3651352.1 FtsK/SpoIIIE domain-containing protein [Metabacillus litoralis]